MLRSDQVVLNKNHHHIRLGGIKFKPAKSHNPTSVTLTFRDSKTNQLGIPEIRKLNCRCTENVSIVCCPVHALAQMVRDRTNDTLP